MKTAYSLLLALLLTGCATFPQKDLFKNQPPLPMEKGKALVYVIYPEVSSTVFKLALPAPVYFKLGGAESMPINVLVFNSYFYFYATPQAYTFTATFPGGHGNSIPFTTTLQAGKIYYLELFQTPGMWVSDLWIADTDESYASSVMQNYLSCNLVDCRQRQYRRGL